MGEEDGGNHGSRGDMINPELCLSYRKHMEDRIKNMEKSINGTIKIVGAITALIIVIVEFALTLFF